MSERDVPARRQELLVFLFFTVVLAPLLSVLRAEVGLHGVENRRRYEGAETRCRPKPRFQLNPPGIESVRQNPAYGLMGKQMTFKRAKPVLLRPLARCVEVEAADSYPHFGVPQLRPCIQPPGGLGQDSRRLDDAVQTQRRAGAKRRHGDILPCEGPPAKWHTRRKINEA